jgi:membrane associated rhomboid family serine protease
MGIYDRDYYRASTPSSVGQMRMWSVTTWLIVINVAVFLLDPILYRGGQGIAYSETVHINPPVAWRAEPPLWGIGHFSLSLAIGKLQLWRFITFQFLHAGLGHLLMNMIGLYFFGPMIESYLGSRRFLAFYLLCGIGGPVAYFILWAMRFLIAYPWVPLVGASAGIFGILIAAARVAPNATVLVYGILPARLKTVALVLLAVAAYTVLAYGGSGRHNAGGEAAHLGGAGVGFLFIRNPQWLRLFDFDFASARRRKPPF